MKNFVYIFMFLVHFPSVKANSFKSYATNKSACALIFQTSLLKQSSLSNEDLVKPRSWKQIPLLKLSSYNVENLSFKSDVNKIEKLAQVLLLENPDILVLQEVHGEGVLRFLNKYFLHDQYQVIFVPGNDQQRSIAFMVKKDLPFPVSYTHLTLPTKRIV